MKRSIFCSLVLVVFLGVAGCGGDDDSPDAAPIILTDAAVPDAADPIDATPPLDAQLFDLQAAVGIDDAEIVGGQAFLNLGTLALSQINGMLQGQIDDGTLLLALEWRGLDDPSGQDDVALDIGFYQCEDPDGETANNFDATNPDRWVASASSVDTDGQPSVVFPDGTLVGGVLSASSTGTITLPGLPIPVAITNPTLSGVLTAAPDDLSVHYLEDGVDAKSAPVNALLTGAITADTLGAAPDFLGLCPGDNLLDILAAGCDTGLGVVIPPSQPDTDIDGDGLEKLCDDCTDEACGGSGDADAGMPDGIIDCCWDPDVGQIAGTNCWTDAEIADGYQLDLAIHGTRIILMSGVDPN